MIINSSNHICLASHVEIANRTLSRTIGLMGRRKIEIDHALLIYPCQQIHTYFMKFTIDCLFIDKQYQVVQIIEGLKPWKISKKIPAGWGVIELPEGLVKETDTHVNDRLILELK